MMPEKRSHVVKLGRQAEKQASRDADEKAVSEGADPATITVKNAFLTADRTIVHWDRSSPL